MLKDTLLDISRALALLRVGLKYGTGAGLRSLLGQPRRDGRPEAYSLRRALEELGLTYVKLGQFLAIRHDLLPPEVCRELSGLFDRVRPFPFEAVRAAVESELRRPLAEAFPRFDPEPVAAASVAQVHEARTAQGERVAVKVQRPGIERVFAADSRNLRRLASLADALGVFGTLSVRETVDQFVAYTSRELDFVREGRTADRLRVNALPDEVLPRIHWSLSTARVLTMDFIEGLSLSRVIQILEREGAPSLRARYPGLDLDRFLKNLTDASLHQLFVIGFFHGDPHPGNILVCPGNKVGFVDFGIFGDLDPSQRELFTSYTENLALGNLRESYRAIARIYSPTGESDPRAFQREVIATLTRWYQASRDPDAPLEETHLGRPFDEMVKIVQRHRYRADLQYLLFWRALIVLDSIALRVSPGFDLTENTRRFFAAFGPSPRERIRRLLAGRSPLPAAPFRAPARAGSILAGSKGGRARLQETPAFRRNRSVAALSLGLALLAAAAGVLARLLPPDAAVRGPALALLALLAAAGVRWR